MIFSYTLQDCEMAGMGMLFYFLSDLSKVLIKCLSFFLKWGEGFYSRNVNETPRSPEKEVAKLQKLFAKVKRRHEKNNRRWRKKFSAQLLALESQNLRPPRLTDEYEKYRGHYCIEFKTSEYQNWVS